MAKDHILQYHDMNTVCYCNTRISVNIFVVLLQKSPTNDLEGLITWLGLQKMKQQVSSKLYLCI